jgi:gluconokinase
LGKPNDRDHGRNSQRASGAGYGGILRPRSDAGIGCALGGIWVRRQGERESAQAIVIMGVSGSGKSTLAALLAAKLDCPFFEGDDFHSPASIAKMRSGKPLTDADRWPWLDRIGAALGKAVRKDGCAVAACSALRRPYRDRLRVAVDAPVAFILLDVGREELMCRLSSRPHHYMPASLLDSQLATLERPDETERSLTLDSNLDPEELGRRAMAWLAESDAATERTSVRAVGP